jgi:hypothetical protein
MEHQFAFNWLDGPQDPPVPFYEQALLVAQKCACLDVGLLLPDSSGSQPVSPAKQVVISRSPSHLFISWHQLKKSLPMSKAILGLLVLSVVFTAQVALRNGRHPVNSSCNF